MVKRQAEESLEDVLAANSPASKKARVDHFSGLHSRTNGSGHLLGRSVLVDGEQREEDERNGNDILAAADEIAEELEEAAVDPVDQDEKSAYSVSSRQQAPTEGFSDLYLDTINRSVLDFDFEKLCSVTLSNINVYACLVCGKYYQGRGPKSHAYFHALEVGHHVYVNMQTKRVYVLPEGYEVKSKSLDDIKFVVDPQLSREEVVQLDKEAKDAWDLAGKKYRPGTIIFLWMVKNSELLHRNAKLFQNPSPSYSNRPSTSEEFCNSCASREIGVLFPSDCTSMHFSNDRFCVLELEPLLTTRQAS